VARPSGSSFPIPKLWVPLDKNEGGVKGKDILSSVGHRFFAREVEDQDSGNENLTLITRGGHLLPKTVPPTIDTA
jgi:hypothetical protein